jgi:hypothetical protein
VQEHLKRVRKVLEPAVPLREKECRFVVSLLEVVTQYLRDKELRLTMLVGLE